MVSDGTTITNKPPNIEPIIVKLISNVKSCRLRESPFKKGIVPPILIKIRANILVAIAFVGEMPNSSIIGIVIKELLPVTTPIMLVNKKITIKSSNCRFVKIKL
jgi:hypothetical protein